MFYVYILKSLKDGNFYIGYTNDLKRRILEHNGGMSKSTKSRAPFELKYYESFSDKQDAVSREYQLKKNGRALAQLKNRAKNSLL